MVLDEAAPLVMASILALKLWIGCQIIGGKSLDSACCRLRRQCSAVKCVTGCAAGLQVEAAVREPLHWLAVGSSCSTSCVFGRSLQLCAVEQSCVADGGQRIIAQF